MVQQMFVAALDQLDAIRHTRLLQPPAGSANGCLLYIKANDSASRAHRACQEKSVMSIPQRGIHGIGPWGQRCPDHLVGGLQHGAEYPVSIHKPSCSTT